MILKLRGKKDKEPGAYITVAFGANPATMILGNFFHDGETDTGTGIFGIAMKTGEDIEDALGMLRLEADAIVANLDQAKLLRRS